VGTGPYVFGDWQRDEKLVLNANQQYWRGAPTPGRLTFRVIKDPTTRVAELRTGGVDIIANPPVPQLEALAKGDTSITAVKGGRIIFFAFQLNQPPFNNRKVREAANLAVNRHAIVESVLGGRGVELAGPFTSATLGFDASVKAHAYDPARARPLLAEAGYPTGFDTTWSVSSGAFLKDKVRRRWPTASAGRIRIQLIPTGGRSCSRTFRAAVSGIISGAWGSSSRSDAGMVYRPYLPLRHSS
jgi:peptide/nickel transport system substrate-binding protein